MKRLLQAIYFATLKHAGQTRKDKKTAYISHPLAVGVILSRITDDENTIIAGILHDIVEDSRAKEQEVMRLFGPEVTRIVMECSEKDKSKSWKDRKQEVLEEVNHLSNEAALVKSADSLHNLYELVEKFKEFGLSYFDNFNASVEDKMEYERKKLEKFKRCHKDNSLLAEIENYLQFLEHSIKSSH